MSAAKTVADLLQPGADEAVAIAAPGRPSLTYAGLRKHVAGTVRRLNQLGIGRNDPVAIVLPNGPEMATAFLSVAAAATTAPLNPAYREEEFEFYLSDLKAKLLLVEAGSETPARAVARKHGIRVAELTIPSGAASGLFDISGSPAGDGPSRGGTAESGDIALVLHTSGTTSRPKLVPLSQQNICASAASVARSLALGPGDRCLNVMPLFHIHGLIAAVMSSLGAGASVFCTPGFNGLKFFSWLQEAAPSWYTAVPTMHQTILERAARNREVVEAARLRLIRSSSASLPPRVMQALEETFHAPVIESYGMTEAAHQMTSNPLPPRERKPGSVGVAAGPEVLIMDKDGRLLPSGSVGEVVIRGPNVTLGYQNNPEANAAGFTNGWFRTGDEGTIDEAGYLRLTGRLKEIINRGGEKISPREVDEILLDHPAVLQAVTFAMPHDKLGEDVAAALILHPGAAATEKEIREFVAQRLAGFKVPRRVLFLGEIPKGPTGKLQRIGLAEKLGLVQNKR
ncbi:MAG: acyl--CoA ligase [Acidobacteria bacterium]|nr:acyl--CoA ligase [Acidobacteriota bacterium]